jgi:preprotein translocase subunit SecG
MSVLLVLQIIIVVCMIVAILLQKSSADGMVGASSSTSFMSGRASANLLTRVTSFLAAAFILNSLVLAYLSSHSDKTGSIVGESDVIEKNEKAATPEEKKAPEPVLPDAEELPVKKDVEGKSAPAVEGKDAVKKLEGEAGKTPDTATEKSSVPNVPVAE